MNRKAQVVSLISMSAVALLLCSTRAKATPPSPPECTYNYVPYDDPIDWAQGPGWSVASGGSGGVNYIAYDPVCPALQYTGATNSSHSISYNASVSSTVVTASTLISGKYSVYDGIGHFYLQAWEDCTDNNPYYSEGCSDVTPGDRVAGYGQWACNGGYGSSKDKYGDKLATVSAPQCPKHTTIKASSGYVELWIVDQAQWPVE